LYESHVPSANLKRLQRRWAIFFGRRTWMPYVELATLGAFLTILAISYLILAQGSPGQRLLTPPFVALMLICNLVPAIALIVLIGRRVARKRAAQSQIGGNGRLHVRLVGLFSLIATVPMLLVVIFASLLFQYGVEFWFSDKARGMLQNANSLAQGYYAEKQQNVVNEITTMAGDLREYLSQGPSDSPAFAEGYGYQVVLRNLSESAIIEMGQAGPRTIAMVNPDARPVEKRVSQEVVRELSAGKPVFVIEATDRIEAVTRLYPDRNIYLYASRLADRQALNQTKRAKAVLADYEGLISRSRNLQLQFNAALFFISLLIVGVAVWIALKVADRLVRPVGELVHAARRVTGGDLSTRVASPRTMDEVGILSTAFNRMTQRLEVQTSALEGRRAFIEAILSGVSAGVVSIDANRRVHLMNDSAQRLLTADNRANGAALIDVAPEIDTLIQRGQSDGIIQVTASGESRTLAVKITGNEGGHVLTFDDITQQISDQRRAAWSDVARRIAHEIKNPLTPIQLAAERLKRRYAAEVTSDKATFVRLTDTIVRQVSDLRRMVDEFSSFARMPKPIFELSSLVEIARQAIFLHEVAHPGITFRLEVTQDELTMVCDRRQLGQALTNIIKNACEAIAQNNENVEAQGVVVVSIKHNHGKKSEQGNQITIDIADTGIGLPPGRDRIVEPYVTTRARGSGLGLAIVQKIVEEHFGVMSFSDRDGGGTIVRLAFDPALLAPLSGFGTEAGMPPLRVSESVS
jgi:two-component system, NtrC family, nitrogen regulation sensor histidine kinase NtrY